MIKDKLTYQFPNQVPEEKRNSIQDKVCWDLYHPTNLDCKCEKINVTVTPDDIPWFFTATFNCDCGKARPPIRGSI